MHTSTSLGHRWRKITISLTFQPSIHSYIRTLFLNSGRPGPKSEINQLSNQFRLLQAETRNSHRGNFVVGIATDIGVYRSIDLPRYLQRMAGLHIIHKYVTYIYFPDPGFGMTSPGSIAFHLFDCVCKQQSSESVSNNESMISALLPGTTPGKILIPISDIGVGVNIEATTSNEYPNV